MNSSDMTILLLIRERTPPPTIRELGKLLDKSNGFIQGRIDRLVELGYLKKEKGKKSRTVNLTKSGWELISIWALGKEVDGKVTAPWDGK